MSDCIDPAARKITLPGGPLIKGNQLVIDGAHVEEETGAAVPLTGKVLRCYLTLRNATATPLVLLTSTGDTPGIAVNAAAGTYTITLPAGELDTDITPGVGYWLICDMYDSGDAETLETLWYAEVSFVDLPSPAIA